MSLLSMAKLLILNIDTIVLLCSASSISSEVCCVGGLN